METKDGESQAAQVEMMLPGWSPRVRVENDTTPDTPTARLPRVTRLMALAIKFQEMVSRGELRDYADIARLGYVTRARATQIMNLVNLAPNIQEQLLFPEPTATAAAVAERDLRGIVAPVYWGNSAGSGEAYNAQGLLE